MKKKVLLVDSSFSAYPLYKALMEYNVEVHVVGLETSYSFLNLVDNVHRIDYSNKKLLRNLISEAGIEYVVPGCTDLSYKMCSLLNLKSGTNIDSLKNYEILNNKLRFMDFAKSQGIPVPLTFNDISTVVFPVIVKPVDSFSGKGVSIAHSHNELKMSIRLAKSSSLSSSFLVEEFVSGQLFSFSCFIEADTVVKFFFVEEHCNVYPYAVDTSFFAYKIDEIFKTELIFIAEKISKLLSLKDGLLHIQFIISNESIKIIEVTRRCPGDLYSLLIKKTNSYDYAKKYVSYFIDESYTSTPKAICDNLIVRQTITSATTISFESFNFLNPEYVSSVYPLIVTGASLLESPKGRAAIVFHSFSNRSDMDSFVKECHACCSFNFN